MSREQDELRGRGEGMSAQTYDVLVKYGAGAVVGVDLFCPRYDCGRRWKGTAIVVNEYGVRDPLPPRCRDHDLLGRIERIVDVEAEGAKG